MSEKSFQSYFMRLVPHGYRTSLVNGGGFPDCLLIDGDKHSLVELKLLTIGPSGNKMLRGLYKPSQLPWHLKYLKKEGSRVYTVFKLNDCYGAVHETPEYIREVLNGMKYLQLKEQDYYREYKTLKELISEEFPKSDRRNTSN